MEHKVEIRQKFDELFKRKVIEEYLSTRQSKMSIQRKYNIHFKSAICTWMKRLGYTEKVEQKCNLASLKRSILSNSTPKPTNAIDADKKIRDLERQLEDAKLQAEAYKRIIEKAEKELNIPIRKKHNTK